MIWSVKLWYDRNFKTVEGDVMNEINFCAVISGDMYALEKQMREGSEYRPE